MPELHEMTQSSSRREHFQAQQHEDGSLGSIHRGASLCTWARGGQTLMFKQPTGPSTRSIDMIRVPAQSSVGASAARAVSARVIL